jgi:hypothetical protein
MNYVEFGTFQRKIKLDRHFTIFSVGHLGYLRHIKYNNWIYENDNSVVSSFGQCSPRSLACGLSDFFICKL